MVDAGSAGLYDMNRIYLGYQCSVALQLYGVGKPWRFHLAERSNNTVTEQQRKQSNKFRVKQI